MRVKAARMTSVPFCSLKRDTIPMSGTSARWASHTAPMPPLPISPIRR